MWPWLWLAIVILAALPWALWCGGRRGSGGSSALVICLCLSISLGCLTLLMFGFGVFGISLRFWVINLPYFAAMAIGGRLIWRDRAQLAPLRLWPETWERRSIWLMCAAIAIAQLINASYWPFFRDDAQGIYAPYAAEIYETRALVSLKGKADIASRYDSYPMMMPLAYAYAYMSAGVEQEYLAKTLATLLAIATMPAAYLLGRSAHSESVGWLAAGLLALTPAFWRWASAGYVDLPMAFFYTMVGYFVLRLWRSGRTSDAFLTGLHFGLACWVKNAGLVAAPLLAVWLVLACFRGSVRWRQVFVVGLAAFFGGLAWYVWTYWQAGVIVPRTAWTERAQHSLETLFIFVQQWNAYAFVGWLIMIGLGYTLWKFWRNGLAVPGYASLLLWVLPFWLVWWWFVSYDPRFVLLFLPPACVIGALFVADAWSRWPLHSRSIATAIVLIAAAVWTAQGALISIQFKDELLADPFMSHAAKATIVRPAERES